MKIEDILGMESYKDMSDEKLRELLQQIRHNRMAETCTTKVAKTKTAKPATLEGKMKKLGITPEQLAELLKAL